MPRIAIDASPLLPKPSGIGLYVANLIAALEDLQSTNTFELDIVFRPGIKNWLRGMPVVPDYLHSRSPRRLVPFPDRLSKLFIKSPRLFLPPFERTFGSPDIFHGTNYAVFPFRRSLRAMTIYDLGFMKFPAFTDSNVATFAEQLRRCLTWTDLVLTISESSKQDIVELLGFDPDKIHVTPLASRYDAHFLSDERKAELAKAIDYDFSRPYLLFVSTIEPRKNIVGLVEAFDYLKRTHQIDHQLVLIGKPGWRYEPIFERIEKSPYRDRIHHLSYLSDEEVALFYARADVFVYPSHYEGFGLPVLEAMTLGAPVVTTNVSSLPEVAGNAAILVAPDDSMALAEGIYRTIVDRDLRDRLIRDGHIQASSFSWKRTAEATLKAYQTLLKTR